MLLKSRAHIFFSNPGLIFHTRCRKGPWEQRPVKCTQDNPSLRIKFDTERTNQRTHSSLEQKTGLLYLSLSEILNREHQRYRVPKKHYLKLDETMDNWITVLINKFQQQMDMCDGRFQKGDNFNLLSPTGRYNAYRFCLLCNIGSSPCLICGSTQLKQWITHSSQDQMDPLSCTLLRFSNETRDELRWCSVTLEWTLRVTASSDETTDIGRSQILIQLSQTFATSYNFFFNIPSLSYFRCFSHYAFFFIPCGFAVHLTTHVIHALLGKLWEMQKEVQYCKSLRSIWDDNDSTAAMALETTDCDAHKIRKMVNHF